MSKKIKNLRENIRALRRQLTGLGELYDAAPFSLRVYSIGAGYIVTMDIDHSSSRSPYGVSSGSSTVKNPEPVYCTNISEVQEAIAVLMAKFKMNIKTP